MSSFRGFRPQLLVLIQRAPCRCAPQPGPARILLRAQVPSRFFQTAISCRAVIKPSAIRTAIAHAATKSTSVRQGSFAHQLAAKKTRTLLYEAPSHFWFTFSCFSAATFCVSYAVFHYWSTILYPPEGMAWWVPHGFAVICIFMAGMGTYFLSGATRIVRSIEAVPATLVKAAKGAKPTKVSTPIYIEVSVRRLVPFMGPKKVIALPEEVKMPFRLQAVIQGLYQGNSPLSMREQIRMARVELERKEAARKHQMDHLMTAPFRDAGRGISGAWDGVKRAITKQGFANIKVKDTSYRLDITDCWTLDSGRALDRVVAVRPNEMRDS